MPNAWRKILEKDLPKLAHEVYQRARQNKMEKLNAFMHATRCLVAQK